MTDGVPADPPSPFVIEWEVALARAVPQPRRALDLAMGRGRHAVALARTGYRVFGVDIGFDAVRDASERGRAEGLTIRGWCADLTDHPIPRARFELIVVTRYLQRNLFPALREALVSGGAIIYETFTTAQRAHGRGPTSRDHLLEPGELRETFESFRLIRYEEVKQPDAVARLVAVKR
jgi:tellurite methyltransferase